MQLLINLSMKYSQIYFWAILLVLVGSCRKIRIGSKIGNASQEISILALKKLYRKSQQLLKIEQDLKITGTVIGNDKNSNIYKKIIIQDSSSGIAINLDAYSLYTQYPIGQKVTINCRGLSLADFANTISLGLGEPASGQNLVIPEPLIGQYLSKIAGGQAIVPKLVDIHKLSTKLQDPYQNTLVKIANIQADSADFGKTLADPSKLKNAKSYIFKDCRRQKIEIRTSSYAQFAGEKIAEGRGYVIGIFSAYVNNNSNSKIITLRSAEELQLTEVRCSFHPQKKTIAEIRKYPQNEIFPADWYIEATVISNSKNEPQLNYVLQDETAGILIRFDKISYDHKWKLNEKVRLSLELLQLTNFHGNLQIARIPAQNARKLTENLPKNPVPKGKTIVNLHQEIKQENTLPHTLVALTNVKVEKKHSLNYTQNSGEGKQRTCYAITNYQENQTATWQDTIYTCLRAEAEKEIHLTNYANGSTKIDSIKGYVAEYQGRAQIYLRTGTDIVAKQGVSASVPKKRTAKPKPVTNNQPKTPKTKTPKKPREPKTSKTSRKK